MIAKDPDAAPHLTAIFLLAGNPGIVALYGQRGIVSVSNPYRSAPGSTEQDNEENQYKEKDLQSTVHCIYIDAGLSSIFSFALPEKYHVNPQVFLF
jgi:hypothetical protein